MSTSKPKPADSYLPPYPKRLYILNIAGFTAVALLSVNLLELIWGIEPRWSWFPYTATGFGLYLARSVYEWWFTRPPFGPYAEPTRRSKLIVGLVALAAFAAVLTPAATAHPPEVTTEQVPDGQESYQVQVGEERVFSHWESYTVTEPHVFTITVGWRTERVPTHHHQCWTADAPGPFGAVGCFD